MPRSPRQPYAPFSAARRFQLIGFSGVEVAGVEEERANLDHAAEPALPDEARDLLAARIEGELRRAPHEQVRPGGDLAVDRLVRRQVDSERLLPEEVLPGAESRRVELLVQMVRYSAVDGVDRIVRNELVPA